MLFFLLFAFYQSCLGQWNAGLLRHFEKHDLFLEYETYLKQIALSRPNEDTLHYYQMRLAALQSDEAAVYQHIVNHSGVRNIDTCFYDRQVLRMIIDHAQWRDSLFSCCSNDEVSFIPESLQAIYDYLESEGKHGSLPESLDAQYQRWLKYQHRTKWGAVWRSALLPGWGRHYAGRKATLLNGTIVNLTFGAQLAESIILFGMTNPYTIVVAIGFQFFYFGEIIGSAKALELVRKELKHQLLIDASHALLDNYSCRP
jgi:hypothetical protein